MRCYLARQKEYKFLKYLILSIFEKEKENNKIIAYSALRLNGEGDIFVYTGKSLCL